VNLILFRQDEIGKPLPKRDDRTIHLVKVLHKSVGDYFDAGLLNGPVGLGRIIAIEPDGSLGVALELDRPAPERLPLRVAVGFPRPIQLRRLLRDLSSLGVSHIDLLVTELGEKSYQDTTLLSDGGAEQALIEGAIQSRDTTLPVIATYPSLRAWLAAQIWGKGLTHAGGAELAPDRGALAHEGQPASVSQKLNGVHSATGLHSPDGVQPVKAVQAATVLQPAQGSESPCLLIAPDNVRPQGALADLALYPGGAAVLVIGSERGWSEAERDQLESAGFLRLSMGSRALRTETACVAAAILALEKIGALR